MEGITSSCLLCSQFFFSSPGQTRAVVLPGDRIAEWCNNSCWFLCVITIATRKHNEVSFSANKFLSDLTKSNCWVKSNPESVKHTVRVVFSYSWFPAERTVIWLRAAGTVWFVTTWPWLWKDLSRRHQCLKRLLSVGAVFVFGVGAHVSCGSANI